MVEFEEVKENQRNTQFQFVVSELDLAITFCETALTAERTARAERNKQNAKDAYASALHFAKRVKLTAKMVSEINERVRVLKGLLRQLNLTDEVPNKRPAHGSSK